MKLVRSIEELHHALKPLRGSGTLALVPTMGARHAGHMALIDAARKQATTVAVSIYVNPRQFGPNEDFTTYPRMLDEDRERCRASGVDLIFAPESLYSDNGPSVTLRVDPSITHLLCGASRSGHFDGVATVVAILFNLIRPDIALFGEKDWQQAQIIRRMVKDLHFPLRIGTVPTVREQDGLALSSRNRRLSAGGRLLAPEVYRALRSVQEAVKNGECNRIQLETLALQALRSRNIDVEYLEIRHETEWEQPEEVDASSRIFVAAHIDGVRLIDNLSLNTETTS